MEPGNRDDSASYVDVRADLRLRGEPAMQFLELYRERNERRSDNYSKNQCVRDIVTRYFELTRRLEEMREMRDDWREVAMNLSDID